MNTFLILLTLVLLFPAATALHAQVPQLINYQGRVAVNGVNFDGSGQFKFAIVNAGGTTTYWSNDGTSTAGSEPAAAVTLFVSNGNYSVLLGDTTLPNMTAIPAGVFNNSDVLLRVWFNDGANGSQLLTPDQSLQMDNTTTDCTDAWLERASGAPPARNRHTAVWTGSEMIIWGGRDYNHVRFSSGGRYNPAANSWTAVNPTGAPTARSHHTAVWTGTEMIIWGGGVTEPGGFNTGGRYNPAGNSWTEVTTTGAPAARMYHTAVWTGSEMIVWGGGSGGDFISNRSGGGRYNPAANTWTGIPNSLPNTPSVRSVHTAVWSGSEMIVWGGVGGGAGTALRDGGRYNPAGNTWASVNTIGAPEGRWVHTTVWTGSEMIVWGGYFNGLALNTGGRYRPAGDSWTAVTTTGAPARRWDHSAAWTGSEMIVWGGYINGLSLNTGGRYNSTRDSWTAVSATSAPAERFGHTAVWTGSEMIVWGGQRLSGTFNDTFSYIPDCRALRITNAVLDSGKLILSFPTVTGRTYTLWRSDNLTSDPWTDTGLAALTGTGATLTFTLPAPAAGVPKRFFRVHADP